MTLFTRADGQRWKKNVATITIDAQLSKNRFASGFRVSLIRSGCKGVTRERQRVVAIAGYRMEKGAVPGRIAPAGCEITPLILAASFVSTPFPFPAETTTFCIYRLPRQYLTAARRSTAIARRCRNENFSGRLVLMNRSRNFFSKGYIVPLDLTVSQSFAMWLRSKKCYGSQQSKT